MTKRRVRKRKLSDLRSLDRTLAAKLESGVGTPRQSTVKAKSRRQVPCQLCDRWTKPWLPLCHPCWLENGKPSKGDVPGILAAKVAAAAPDPEDHDVPQEDPWAIQHDSIEG